VGEWANGAEASSKFFNWTLDIGHLTFEIDSPGYKDPFRELVDDSHRK